MQDAPTPSATGKLRANDRLRAWCEARDIPISIQVMEDSTRTAEDAAKACGCHVSEIVKSLVFADTETGGCVLVLVAGDNRLDLKHFAATQGRTLARADARHVRDETGFAIGGIPPFGHARPLPTYIDRGLLGHERVFAAAGTPLSLFAIDPKLLTETTNAIPMDAGP